MTRRPYSLSVVIPAYNEADSLVELQAQLALALSTLGPCEIIYVDDGSRDHTWSAIQQLTVSRSPDTRGLKFRRNFGKAAALQAGFQAARGEWLVTLDADLQDDPAEIAKLLAVAQQGYDVVNGWKQRRQDPWHKVYPSWVFNWLVSSLTGVKLHDHNCGLKLLHHSVAAELRLYGERHRFIPVLAAANGFRVAECPVHHRPRQHGHSKYGIRRFMRGFLDLLTVSFLTGYGQRPQHLLGASGLVMFVLGGIGLTWLAITWVMMNLFGVWPIEPIGSRPLLAYSIALTVLGAQALSLGLLAELIVHYLSRPEDSYYIAAETLPAVPDAPLSPAVDGRAEPADDSLAPVAGEGAPPISPTG